MTFMLQIFLSYESFMIASKMEFLNPPKKELRIIIQPESLLYSALTTMESNAMVPDCYSSDSNWYSVTSTEFRFL